ncbi:hypothetical protein [Herbaspirillum sp. RV1423]|uniref:hypothetical protein n=1 Tax=Herbaspirillum sp. RV1423 TaxID=1443993 RepID=UPI0009DEA258|nr:hypothetical protein [Herbaspirillum sp. RV1423]
MSRNPVTPVRPVDPVGAVRRVDSGSTYFRHLDLWRLTSEVHAAERRAKKPGTRDDDFARVLSCAANPDTEV